MSRADSDNWTAQQAQEYKDWLDRAKLRREADKPRLDRIYAPKGGKPQKVWETEQDIAGSIRNACQFGELALNHSEIFDDSGFEYCVEKFLTHARLASDHLKKYKKIVEG